MSQTAAVAERLAESHKTTRYIIGYAVGVLWKERGGSFAVGQIVPAFDAFLAEDAETQAKLVNVARFSEPGMAE